MVEKQKMPTTYVQAKAMLPVELHSIFDELVTDYKFASFKHTGREWAATKVLAELVLAGWKRSELPNLVKK